MPSSMNSIMCSLLGCIEGSLWVHELKPSSPQIAVSGIIFPVTKHLMRFPYTPCLKNRCWKHWRWWAITEELCLCAFFPGPTGAVGSKWTTSHRCGGQNRMICTSLPNAQRRKHSSEYFFLDRTKTDLMEESACCSLTSAVCFSASPVKLSTTNKQSAMSWNTRIQRADSNEITLGWVCIQS